MKKLLFLILALALVFPVSVFAAGECTQAVGAIRNDKNQIQAKTITFTCTGDSSDGSVPNTDTSAANTKFVNGWYLYRVEAIPTTSPTIDPDEANVFVYDADGLDLLGSEDGGTTAYAGLSLLHKELAKATLPNVYLSRAGLHVNYFPIIDSVLTLDVDDQATASAAYEVVFTFVR